MAAQAERGVTPALDLPDFNLIANSHHELAAELSKCANIPAMTNGDAILRAIQALNQRFDRLESRLKAVDANNLARLTNSMLVEADAELSPLRNTSTDEPIDGFPEKGRQIASLLGPALNNILRALGADIQGSVDTKRKRLRVLIGLKASPP